MQCLSEVQIYMQVHMYFIYMNLHPEKIQNIVLTILYIFYVINIFYLLDIFRVTS